MRGCLDDAALCALIREDAPHGDLTTRALAIGTARARIEFRARAPMTVCATEEAARMFELEGARVAHCQPSGSKAEAGGLLLVAEGSAETLLLVWKVAQTLVEYASGIASAAAGMVDALRGAGLDTPVACTRKNFPGTKAIASKAVEAGGAVMHRLGLSETLLVFPEHRSFMDDAQLPGRIARLKRTAPEKKLVVEVGTIDDALRFAHLGADVIQLEKFPIAMVKTCRDRLFAAGLHPLVAAAGGITTANVVDYAHTGIDVLVSSAPYSALPKDVNVSLSHVVR